MKDGMLEFSDWPMFDLLMTDKELCREVIEIILDESIADIEYIVTEDDVRPTLTNHGVRLDAFVKTKNEIYDIEMQTTKREDLGRRMRYYQGALDTLTLRKGEGYEELPPCIIIFICMHDPFDEGLPVYTLDVNCLEKPSARIGHGFLWKALSAPAWDKLPEGRLQNLLHYVWKGEAGEDPLMGQLAVAVKKANKNENWRKEKMALLTFEEDMEIQRRIAEKKGQERGQIIGLQMGLEQGLAEGLEQGLAEGREQGLAEGREQGLAEGREHGLAEGREHGLAEGREQGLAEGRAEAASEVASLMALLLGAERLDDARRAAVDESYRDELMREFGISQAE